MALTLSVQNILQFYTVLSPIFISVFLLFQSVMKGDLKGIVWIIGAFLAWAIGMGIKSIFASQDQARPVGERKHVRKSFIDRIEIMRETKEGDGLPDYCSVFQGPFEHQFIHTIKLPSLNAIFHAFTISYIAMGVGSNSKPSNEGIIFLIVLGILALMNGFYRKIYDCDDYMDLFVGAVLGTGLGVAWFFAIKAVNPSWTYYSEEDMKGKCVLGEQKFKCTYD